MFNLKSKKTVMKKLLLISTVLLAGACVVNAQSQRLSVKHSSKAYPVLKTLPTNDAQFPSSSVIPSNKTPKPSALLSSRRVGYTCYELQSNNAPPRNIINHTDGTLSFAWTIDDACATGNANRGSGYNYWNGTGLLVPTGTTSRLETVRTGFSQIALLGNGKEVVFAHKNAPHDYQMSTNAAKGSNTWTGVAAGATTLLATPGSAPTQGLWARIATGGPDGNTIHLLSGFTTNAGKDKGIETPTVYCRSTDAGMSWADQNVMLPGYDSSRTLFGSGEEYTVDANGSTVAVVFAGLDADATLWKSTDNGVSFTRTFIDSFLFAPSIDSMGGPTDTAETCDGASSVVVGTDGKVHVAYSTMRVLNDAVIGDDKFSIFPGDAGLIYWNDAAKQKVSIPIDITDVDAISNGGNGNNVWDIGQWTSNINANAAPGPNPSARYGNRAFLTIPSIAVDGNNVFIVFSLVTDGDSTPDGQGFRDIWAVASADGGATFGPIQNITCTQQEEEFFSSVAKRVDNFLHVLYNYDTEPGTNIQNGDPITNTETHYFVIDKAKLLAGTASCTASGLGVSEQSNSVFSIADNYPNPTSGMTYFDVTMKQNTTVSIEIFNSLGQQAYASSEKLSIGKHTLTVDASTLTSGLYFYTIKSGDAVVSGKMTVVAE